jgi:plasmid stabilization system protein ParE
VSRPVRFEVEAETEYRLAGHYYEQVRDRLGIEFFDAVDATIGRICDRPAAGSRVRGVTADLGVRRRAVTRFPYHVVYIEMASDIRIVAIAHDRRKPGYWSERLPLR